MQADRGAAPRPIESVQCQMCVGDAAQDAECRPRTKATQASASARMSRRTCFTRQPREKSNPIWEARFSKVKRKSRAAKIRAPAIRKSDLCSAHEKSAKIDTPLCGGGRL